MTEYHYSQPRESKDREIEVAYLPPYTLRNSNKQFTGSEAPDVPSLPPEAALQGEKAGGRRRRRRRAYNPLSQTWRFHLVAFCINFHQDYTEQDSVGLKLPSISSVGISEGIVMKLARREVGTEVFCLSGSIYRVRATERLNRGGTLRWRETRVIPGRLPRQETTPHPPAIPGLAIRSL